MNAHFEEIKKTFIINTGSELSDLKDEVVNLDLEDANSRRDLVEEVFLSMHSISGTAPMVGLEGLAILSRKLEIVYDKIRRNEKDFSEPLRVQTIRGIVAIIDELKTYSEKIVL